MCLIPLMVDPKVSSSCDRGLVAPCIKFHIFGLALMVVDFLLSLVSLLCVFFCCCDCVTSMYCLLWFVVCCLLFSVSLPKFGLV